MTAVSLHIFLAILASCNVAQCIPIRWGPSDVYWRWYDTPFTLQCVLYDTAEFSSVTWSKTKGNSTELIYVYDGSEGHIIPPNMSWKYEVLKSNEQVRNFNLKINHAIPTDVGIYGCRVESNGFIYTGEAKVAFLFQPTISQTPLTVLENDVYTVSCTTEVWVPSFDSDYMRPAIWYQHFFGIPEHKPLSESSTFARYPNDFQRAPIFWVKNFTTRASYQDQWEVKCIGEYSMDNNGPFKGQFHIIHQVRISFLPRSSVILLGPRDIQVGTTLSGYNPLWCKVNETAEISSLTWSKTLGKSTELIYFFDGSKGSIVPEPPSNSTSKYTLNEMYEKDRSFRLHINTMSITDAAMYECRVESNGFIYTEKAKLVYYGEPKITQTPTEVLDNRVYSVECSIEVGVASIDTDYINSIQPSIDDLFLTPTYKPISESQTWVDGLYTFNLAPPVWRKNFTTRASLEDQWEATCSGVFYDGGPAFEETKEVGIARNPVITKGPGNHFPRAQESSTILLECQANETADISLVTWSKTFLNSTELIYRYDGNEGKIITPPPSELPWKYRVLESQEQDRKFTLEIGNITLSDVGTYECTVESNGQNYTEQANVSVYGSPRLIQIPEIVLNGEWNYTFLCSVEVAIASNSSELITSAKPNITAWYTHSDHVYLEPVSSEWTGLDPFGGVIPVYSEKYFVFGQADYYNPYFLDCAFSTPEPETFQESQSTQIGVPAEDIKLTPIIATTFYPGDTITCYAFGNPKISSYQWFERREPTVPRVEGQVLTLNNSDLGDNSWMCKATNYINGVPYTVESRRKWFTVGNREIKVITKGPDNCFPSALESPTILLECQVNEAADISLVTWSKTFLGSTELIYTYDGNEGSPRITQIPEIVLQDASYNFRCSVEVAVVDNASEFVTVVKPSVTAWYREDLNSDSITLQTHGPEWTGLDLFGAVIPIYSEESFVLKQADYDCPYLLGCTFSTAEPESLYEIQLTHIAVPVKDVELTPTSSEFKPGDTITCNAYGKPEISSYQWFDHQETSVPRFNGQVLTLDESDIGENEWTCKATNYISGVDYSGSASISFNVVANGDVQTRSKRISLLFIFSFLCFAI